MHHISNSIRELPHQITTYYHETIQQCQTYSSKISSTVLQTFQEIKQSELTQTTIKPWFHQNFAPLDKQDYKILGSSVSLSALILLFGCYNFGISFLPLGVFGGGLLVGECAIYCLKKVTQHYNQEAKKHIQNIRTAAEKINHSDPDFSQMTEERNKLNAPEFSHLKDDLKQLDKNTNKFQDKVDKGKKTFLDFLQKFENKLSV